MTETIGLEVLLSRGTGERWRTKSLRDRAFPDWIQPGSWVVSRSGISGGETSITTCQPLKRLLMDALTQDFGWTTVTEYSLARMCGVLNMYKGRDFLYIYLR